MKRFSLIAIGAFEAEGITDALLKLSNHFAHVAAGKDSSLLEAFSFMDLRPIEQLQKEAPDAHT